MITVDFGKRKNLTLCEYLCRCIKKEIASCRLKAGERLPSRRALSEHLHISVITVQNAYGNLIADGYVYSIEKKGFFVEDVPFALGASQTKGAFRDSPAPKTRRASRISRAFRAAPVPTPHLEKKSVALKPRAAYFADFKNNSISAEKFPFSLWAKIMRRVLNSGDERLLERIPSGGALELREAISRHLRQFRMIDAAPEQIFVGAGTDFLYSMLVQFFGSKIYAVENPGYKQFSAVAKLGGAKCVPIPLDAHGIRIDALERSRAHIVHISPQHHFPTGIVMPYKRRGELLEWARRGRIIIEDDYDSEFRFNGMPMPPLYCADRNSRVVYMNTFSKTLSPSFRISYMVLPRMLLEAFLERTGFFSCPVPSFEQFALARFINEGFYEKHLIKMKNYYKNLRNNLINALGKSKINSIAKINEENSGLHFLLQVESDLSGKELRHRLERHGINIALLSDFYYGRVERNSSMKSLVVNYSGLKKDMISETVARMEKALVGR